MKKYQVHQTYDILTVSVKLKSNNKKDIYVKFCKDTLKVCIKNDIICEGVLFKSINCEESTWYIDNEENILTIECVKLDVKQQNSWWKKLFITDKIELDQTTPWIPVNELSSELKEMYEKTQKKAYLTMTGQLTDENDPDKN